MKLTKNFNTITDPKITGGIEWKDYPFKENAQKLADIAQTIRDYLNCPITVSSGYRSQSKNASLASASKTSQHLHGEALDLAPDCLDSDGLDDLFLALVEGRIKLPHPTSQIIRESDGKGAEWLHIGIKTHRWLEYCKTQLNATGKAKFSKRLTHCEYLVTRDTVNYEAVKYRPYDEV